jgi:oxidoreductase
MEIDVQLLARSIVTAGAIGVSELPKQVEAFRDGPSDAPFTVIPNKGALYLAK